MKKPVGETKIANCLRYQAIGKDESRRCGFQNSTGVWRIHVKPDGSGSFGYFRSIQIHHVGLIPGELVCCPATCLFSNALFQIARSSHWIKSLTPLRGLFRHSAFFLFDPTHRGSIEQRLAMASAATRRIQKVCILFVVVGRCLSHARLSDLVKVRCANDIVDIPYRS